MRILAIDPGNVESGYALIEDYKPLLIGKVSNKDLLIYILTELPSIDNIVIEMVASYGMAVGQTVFETCVWVGRFEQAGINSIRTVYKLYRKDVKMNICGQTRAKDTNIIKALVDRFSFPKHAAKGGKGTKADPGFFYGFKKDIWQAYALGVTWLDTKQQQRIPRRIK